MHVNRLNKTNHKPAKITHLGDVALEESRCPDVTHFQLPPTFLFSCNITSLLTPPVRPNVFSKSGGVKISLPTTEDLNPGAYSSMLSNTEKGKLGHAQLV